VNKIAKVFGFGCFTLLAGIASADQADYTLTDYTKILNNPADYTAWTPLILLALAVLSGWQTLNSLFHKPASELFIEEKSKDLHHRIIEESELTRELIGQKKRTSIRPSSKDNQRNSLNLAGAPVRFEKWRPAQRMPSPKSGEVWSVVKTWIVPRRFELGWAFSMGQQTYIPKNLIWARDTIFAVGCNIEYTDYTRLLHFDINKETGAYLFANKTKKTETTIRKISSIRPDNPDFVMSKLSGICVVKPAFERENYMYSNMGTLIHFEPTLKSKSYRIQNYSEFPVHLSLRGSSKSAAIYGDRCNNIAVSPNSKIFHNAHTFYSLGDVSSIGSISLIWQPKGGHISHVRKGSLEGESYSAERLKPVIQDEYFVTAKWSPSENYILLDGEILSVVETKLIKQRTDFPETNDRFSRFIHHSASAWHPSRDLLVIQGFHRVDDNNLEMRIEIWDIPSLKLVLERDLGQTAEYTSIKWSPDGTRIAFSNPDHSVSIWNLETDEIVDHFIDSSGAKSLHFSPDGQRLCFEYKKNTPFIGIIDAHSAELITTFKGAISEFNETPWHYLGRRLAYVDNEAVEVRELSF